MSATMASSSEPRCKSNGLHPEGLSMAVGPNKRSSVVTMATCERGLLAEDILFTPAAFFGMCLLELGLLVLFDVIDLVV